MPVSAAIPASPFFAPGSEVQNASNEAAIHATGHFHDAQHSLHAPNRPRKLSWKA